MEEKKVIKRGTIYYADFEALRISTGVKKMDKPIVMTLCPICAKPFYESDEHYIKRADLHQKIKGDCMFCNVRTGYDY